MSSNDDGPLYTDPEDEMPDVIRDFILESGIGQRYTCHLLEEKDGELPGTLREYRNEYPEINRVGREWGPGKYCWRFSYKSTGPSGKRDTVVREYRHHLPERAWSNIHKQYEFEQTEITRKNLKEKVTKVKLDNEIDSVLSGNAPGKDPIDEMRRTMSALKDLGVPIGGKVANPLADMIPLIAALAPIIQEMIRSNKGGGGDNGNDMMLKLMIAQQERQSDFMKTLFATAGTLLPIFLPKGLQGENEHMKVMMNTMMNMVKGVADFKMSLNPPEPSMLDKVLEKVGDVLPAILELYKQNKEEREKSFMYKMAMSTPEAQAIKEAAKDPQQLVEMVTRLDTAYGFEVANQILEVAQLKRPESTFHHKEKFAPPSTEGQETQT